jgi:hypothetical protein
MPRRLTPASRRSARRLPQRSPSQAAWSRAGHYTWTPRGLNAESLLYIAVDQVFQGSARLVISRWPKLSAGRLIFGETVSTWADVDVLHDLLEAHRRALPAERLPSESRDEFRARPVTPGDVFASAWPQGLDLADLPAVPPPEWMRRPVFDVTAEMRALAKITFNSAVAPRLDEDQLRRVQKGAD